MRRRIRRATGIWTCVALVALLWAGCADQIDAPEASIEAPESVNAGQPVAVSGAGSSDPQDRALSYEWSFASVPAGAEVSFNDATLEEPSFQPSVPGDYTVELQVSNGVRYSESATATVTVSECGAASPVVEQISGAPSMPGVGEAVRLSADVSDPDNAGECGQSQGLAYDWEIIGLPTGSTAELNQAGATEPSFTPEVAGEYTVELTVTDSTGRQTRATASITVSECGSRAPVIDNVSATPSSPNAGALVQLASDVSDPDNGGECSRGQTLRYEWSLVALPAGSEAQLNDPTAANPTLSVDEPGDYRLRLVVTDSSGRASEPAEVTVTAAECGAAAPTTGMLSASPSTNPNTGTMVQLSANASDADNGGDCSLNQSLSYQWELVALPAGSDAQLNRVSAASPSFTPDVPGNYRFRLVVMDSTGRSSEASTITVTAAECGGAAPTTGALSATPSSPVTGDTVQLAADASDADNTGECGLDQALSYQWSLVGLPAGSSASLNNKNASSPSFTADVPGTYTAEVTVEDSTGRVSETARLSVTAGDCGSNAPVARVEQEAPTTTSPGQQVVAPNVAVGTEVQVSGQASSDPDNSSSCGLSQTLSYQWWFGALPAGSNTALNNSTIVNPSFELDEAGTYELHLLVTDSTGRTSQRATFEITADPLIGVTLQSGFSANLVAESGALGSSFGLTQDSSGNTYIVQNQTNRVVQVASNGAISNFTQGSFMQDPVDITYDPANDRFFATASNNSIIEVASNGNQSQCQVGGGGGPGPPPQFRGITYYDGTGGPRLIVASEGNDDVQMYDPSTCSLVNQNDFGGNLNNPWGVDARDIQGTETLVAANRGGELWRNEGGIYSGVLGTTTEISPPETQSSRDVVSTPCSTSKHVVADQGTGTIYVYDNCQGGGCSRQVLASGLDEPTGLYFEDDQNLLVTDPGRDLLVRIDGNFCGL